MRRAGLGERRPPDGPSGLTVLPCMSLSSGSFALLNSPVLSILFCFQVHGHVITWLSIINTTVPIFAIKCHCILFLWEETKQLDIVVPA